MSMRGRERITVLSRSSIDSLFPNEISRGIAAILFACALNAYVGAGFFLARQVDTSYSPETGIFLRVLMNLSCFLIPLCFGNPAPRPLRWKGNRSLWAWGMFGVITTTTYYLAFSYTTVGTVNFLNAGSGIFIVALAPILCAQSTPISHWLGVIGSLLGLYLLGSPSSAAFTSLGSILATVSGLFGGLAMLMVARTRKAYRPETIMFHWTLVNLVAYCLFLSVRSPVWPSEPAAWGYLLSAGLAAAWSQYFMAYSYQRAPASLVACLTYLGPVLSLAVDVIVFKLHYPVTSLLGAGLILGFGCFFPLWKRKAKV